MGYSPSPTLTLIPRRKEPAIHPPITLQSLTPFDWFLLAIVLMSTVAAFLRGIIKVLFSLGGLIIGIIAAAWYYTPLAERLHRYINSFAAAEVIAFLAILILIMVVAAFAARLVRKAVSTIGLGFLDRLFGAVFGCARGILLGIAVMMAVAAFVPQSSWLTGSMLAPWFLSGAHAVSFVVPEHFQQQVAAGATHLLQQSPELFRPHNLTQPM